MKDGKGRTPGRKSNKTKSRGQAWAERTRSECNTLTPHERARLLERALKIAYGAETESVGAGRH